MTTFAPNRRFRRDYDRLFRKDPDAEIARLMAARFPNPRAYHLPEGRTDE